MGAKSLTQLIRSQLPNALTVVRIFLAFVFPVLEWKWRLVAFIAAMATEFLDGYLARHLGAVTETGIFLDPIADKLFALSVGWTLVMAARLKWIDVFAVLTRDVVVSVTSVFLILTGAGDIVRKFRPHWTGKWATTFQYVYFLSIFTGLAAQSPLFWITVIFSFLAAAVYAANFYQLWHGPRPRGPIFHSSPR